MISDEMRERIKTNLKLAPVKKLEGMHDGIAGIPSPDLRGNITGIAGAADEIKNLLKNDTPQ